MLVKVNIEASRCLLPNLGVSARYDAADDALGRLQNDARSDGDAHSDAPSVAESDGARSDAANGSHTNGSGSGETAAPDESPFSPTLAVSKFASLRGASVYFCHDEECYRCKQGRGFGSIEAQHNPLLCLLGTGYPEKPPCQSTCLVLFVACADTVSGGYLTTAFFA